MPPARIHLGTLMAFDPGPSHIVQQESARGSLGKEAAEGPIHDGDRLSRQIELQDRYDRVLKGMFDRGMSELTA